MRLPERGIFFAIAAVTVLVSFQALSDTQSEVSVTADVHAFDAAWTGEYYVEPAVSESESESFDSFEAKRRHYLESPTIGVDEVELDENGKPLPARDAEDEGEPRPSPSPSPSATPPMPFWRIPYLNPGKDAVPFTWGWRMLPKPRPSASPSPAPLKEQAYYYYNNGVLKNATELESEGKGFIKVFRDRDEKIGGRAWGTRSMIGLIRKMAADFADRFPGRERLQVADIARKNGGKMSHGSHQNGLDADIIYVRKDRREQSPVGGYGKNGFAEQFVIHGSSKRASKGGHGKIRNVIRYSSGVSSNFDVEANFNLLLMFHKAGGVKLYFIDKVLIREMFRYADEHGLAKDADAQAMLMKLEHARSHADHFHVRLFCQAGDEKCVSANGSFRSRSTPKKKKVPK